MKPYTSRSFYAGKVEDFLLLGSSEIIGVLAARLAEQQRSADHDQIRAWTRQIELLKAAFQRLGDVTANWSVLLEVPLLRLGRRMDAVVLSPGVVTVLEFKIGAKEYRRVDLAQTENYALLLRDFHAASQDRIIVPILCADLASTRPVALDPVVEGVTQNLLSNSDSLAEALLNASGVLGASRESISASEFELSPYRPTPSIVEAARALYAGHRVTEIGRGDAAAKQLEQTAERLVSIAREACERRERTICFVTGTPGAGKTLLGLNLALTKQLGNAALPAATLLSGNPPLVHVLIEALAHDGHVHRGMAKPEARRHAGLAIQGLLGFLKEHGDGAPPPERVIVFDEAQRAWNAEIGRKLLGRPSSEPALFLEILARTDWACLICLVGPGQEINRGEGGLSLWGEALAEATQLGQDWRVFAAEDSIAGLRCSGASSFSKDSPATALKIRSDPLLHLASSMRSYRSPLQVRWVDALLSSDLSNASRIAAQMEAPPALISRDLAQVKAWLRSRSRGDRSVGLLASSGAVRLVADGIPESPRSRQLDAIAHWFLRPQTDYRSSSALEVPLSEFGCQGLELDFVGLCWGGDLIWEEKWVPRRMVAPSWQRILATERYQNRLNGYRVLLTRARAGMVIYVPRGCDDDDTRRPRELDRIAAALARSGCEVLT